MGSPSKQMKLGAPLLAEFARSGDFRRTEAEACPFVVEAFASRHPVNPVPELTFHVASTFTQPPNSRYASDLLRTDPAHWPLPDSNRTYLLYVFLVVFRSYSSTQTRNIPIEPSPVDLFPHQQISLLQELPQSQAKDKDIPLSMTIGNWNGSSQLAPRRKPDHALHPRSCAGAPQRQVIARDYCGGGGGGVFSPTLPLMSGSTVLPTLFCRSVLTSTF